MEVKTINILFVQLPQKGWSRHKSKFHSPLYIYHKEIKGGIGMKCIFLLVRRDNVFIAPIMAIVTLLVTHLCCWLPALLVPLGFGSITHILKGSISPLIPSFYLLALSVLTYLLWRTYHNPQSGKSEKISLWLSILVIIIMILT
ncbi:MAG: hypothetical protein ACYC21_01565 [Eubacteriales bacterium]